MKLCKNHGWQSQPDSPTTISTWLNQQRVPPGKDLVIFVVHWYLSYNTSNIFPVPIRFEYRDESHVQQQADSDSDSLTESPVEDPPNR